MNTKNYKLFSGQVNINKVFIFDEKINLKIEYKLDYDEKTSSRIYFFYAIFQYLPISIVIIKFGYL